MHETRTEARNNNKCMKSHSKLTYQLSFQNVGRKVGYHAGGKWFIHDPKRRKGTQLLNLKHLSIACKYEVQGNLFSLWTKNIIGGWLK